ncbi:MAG: hypothetical protein M0Z82_02420 [Actinomycetota bacterium]|nr:hypothetical protein [Actinomycetota bacterium]
MSHATALEAEIDQVATRWLIADRYGPMTPSQAIEAHAASVSAFDAATTAGDEPAG